MKSFLHLRPDGVHLIEKLIFLNILFFNKKSHPNSIKCGTCDIAVDLSN